MKKTLICCRLLFRTVLAVGETAIDRLVLKSSNSLLLHAYIFYKLIKLGKMKDEMPEFLNYLRELFDKHNCEEIVFELFAISGAKVEQLLSEPRDFLSQTVALHFYLRLFSNSISTAHRMYSYIFEQFSPEKLTDQWFISLNNCAKLLLPEEVDFTNLFLILIKTFSLNSLTLLLTLLNSNTYKPKYFAKFLKTSEFVNFTNQSLLVDLMSRFVSFYERDSAVEIDCSKHLPFLLELYKPNLSLNSQHTLACLYQYEKSGFSMLNLQKFELNLLDSKKMQLSIDFYPVNRRLRTIEPANFDHADEIYDPAHLIPMFFHCLASNSIVKCQDFVEKSCLSYCLMALSARCGLLRAVTYNCLTRFEEHLHSQRFFCKEQVQILLNLLKSSLKKSNLKLAPIIARFLAKLVQVFTHPGRNSLFFSFFLSLFL